MPNIWTHLIFGQEVLRRIGRTDLLKPETTNVFNLGCQGPDFLFYHNFLPWQTDTRANVMGELIHHKHCGPFLVEMVLQMRGRQLHDPTVIYVLGFLTHHVLDRNMHPYIHYKSGYKKWNHQRYEVILDTIMAEKFLGLATWNTPVWKQFYIGDDFPEGVVDMFRKAAIKFFPEQANRMQDGDWSQAYRDMVRTQQIFHDPYGIKRLITFGKIEPMVYKRKNPPRDYLNENHAEWHHPAIPEETSNSSVWDLWEQALADGETVLRAAVEFLELSLQGTETSGENLLVEKIGNLSYDTGKPCGSHLELRYADPIV
ncbi:zinc dependent phospholipase C family protein [Effusibacillus lacus]|uniref:Phospholipase C/D domain-containing protein n=1 Tax=Effusibacillus lacus TaxID=1348429 RepID=A0A292YKF6_9BACL|nr:zinc dependent phospholipase C family protein [Effusibacillus lacus]TCS72832.1 zinc dependent phospholipase C [Effusibacillus lacus]GAX89243.1 hypothetical protein EFBL_0861 [Effusibacillus lacus]